MPPGAFELVLVRHGRTAWNAAGRYQGHSDIPLDDVGRAQAAALGRELALDTFDYAVTSDLLRASETAEIVLAGRIRAERDPRWRELDFGAWEGLTRAEIAARALPITANSPVRSARFPTPEGGESFESLSARVAAALHSLRKRMRAGERALVATHAGPLHAALRALLGEADATSRNVTFAPASITTFIVEPHAAHLKVLNRSVAIA